MDEPLDAGGALSRDEVIGLLREIESSLAADPASLPDQQVLRLWWGTEQETAEPIASGVGPIYAHLVDWQEGLVSLAQARISMGKGVHALLSKLRPE